MLTANQIEAIRAHVALDERTRELIRLARWDLYNGPINDDPEVNYPGFPAACSLISDAIEVSDLYLDVEIDEVIGDTEPHWHSTDCGCDGDDPDACEVGYYPEHVIRVDARNVVQALVGRELARYV